MTNFIQKTHLNISFSAFNCLLESQCSLLTSWILGGCSKLKWSNRAYAVYWLRGTLLYPCLALDLQLCPEFFHITNSMPPVVFLISFPNSSYCNGEYNRYLRQCLQVQFLLELGEPGNDSTEISIRLFNPSFVITDDDDDSSDCNSGDNICDSR